MNDCRNLCNHEKKMHFRVIINSLISNRQTMIENVNFYEKKCVKYLAHFSTDLVVWFFKKKFNFFFFFFAKCSKELFTFKAEFCIKNAIWWPTFKDFNVWILLKSLSNFSIWWQTFQLGILATAVMTKASISITFF